MNKTMVNYYFILGINYDATQEQIRNAYRQKAREYHPDAHQGENLSEEQLAEMRHMFTLATDAYQVLKDEVKRLEYDRELSAYLRAEAERQRREQEQRDAEQRAYEEEQRRYEEEQRRYEEERRARQAKRARQHETFGQSIKRQYKEVRRDEKKYPFSKRHERISDSLGEIPEDISIPKFVAIKMGRGTVHVCFETLYQLSKLGYITKDSVPKYILRNRRLAATVLAGAIIFGAASGAKEQPQTNINETSSYTQEYTQDSGSSGYVSEDKAPDKYYFIDDSESSKNIELNITDEIVKMVRVYHIERGDTLSELAEAAHISVDELKEENKLESDRIYEGDIIRIPYMIANADAKYYVEQVNINGRSLLDVAKEYETTIDTLVRLNSGRINKVGMHSYEVVSEEIFVPRYISVREYNDLKYTESVKTK